MLCFPHTFGTVLRFITRIANVWMDVRRAGSEPAQIRIGAVERSGCSGVQRFRQRPVTMAEVDPGAVKFAPKPCLCDIRRFTGVQLSNALLNAKPYLRHPVQKKNAIVGSFGISRAIVFLQEPTWLEENKRKADEIFATPIKQQLGLSPRWATTCRK